MPLDQLNNKYNNRKKLFKFKFISKIKLKKMLK